MTRGVVSVIRPSSREPRPARRRGDASADHATAGTPRHASLVVASASAAGTPGHVYSIVNGCLRDPPDPDERCGRPASLSHSRGTAGEPWVPACPLSSRRASSSAESLSFSSAGSSDRPSDPHEPRRGAAGGQRAARAAPRLRMGQSRQLQQRSAELPGPHLADPVREGSIPRLRSTDGVDGGVTRVRVRRTSPSVGCRGDSAGSSSPSPCWSSSRSTRTTSSSTTAASSFPRVLLTAAMFLVPLAAEGRRSALALEVARLRAAPRSGALRQAPGGPPCARHRGLRRQARCWHRGARGASGRQCFWLWAPCCGAAVYLLPLLVAGQLSNFYLSYIKWASWYVRRAFPLLDLHRMIDADGLLRSVRVLRRRAVGGRLPSREKRACPVGQAALAVAVCLAGAFAVARPGNLFAHYLMLLVPFVVICGGVTSRLAGRWKKARLPRGLRGNGLSGARGAGERRSPAAVRNAAVRERELEYPLEMREPPPLLLDRGLRRASSSSGVGCRSGTWPRDWARPPGRR